MAYRRLDQILCEKGQVSKEQITRALHQQSLRGGRLGEHLLSNGDINETALVEALSEQLHVRGVSITNRSIDPQLFEHLPRSVAEQNLCLPISLDSRDNVLTVAFADPHDREVIRAVERAIHPARLRPAVGLARQIHAALQAPAEEPEHYEVDDSELSACLDLLDLAVTTSHNPPTGGYIDTTRLIQEVSGRIGFDAHEINDLRLASLALAIAEGRADAKETGATIAETASALLCGLGLPKPAEIVDQTVDLTHREDRPGVASQVLLACRGLVTAIGKDPLNNFDLDKWKTDFCSSPDAHSDPEIAGQVIEVMRTRYLREQLLSPVAELLLIGDDPLAASVNRAARSQGFRVVRAMNLDEAVESINRRRPSIVCLLALDDLSITEAETERRIRTLGVPVESVLVLADRHGAVHWRRAAPHVLVIADEQPDMATIMPHLWRAHTRSTERDSVVGAIDDRSDVIITGRLADLGTADLVQVLSTAHKTVRVDFVNGPHHATLWFHGGRIIRGESDAGLAEIAFYHLIGWPEGRFEVRTIQDLPGTNISTATTALLLEALRRIDEKGNLAPSPTR